jgi:hypothetical protein
MLPYSISFSVAFVKSEGSLWNFRKQCKAFFMGNLRPASHMVSKYGFQVDALWSAVIPAVQRGNCDESAIVNFASLAVLAPLREKGLKGAGSILTIKFSKAIGHVEGKWNRTFKWLQGFRWVLSFYRQDAKARRRKGTCDREWGRKDIG